jgi:hypothetical protein
MAKNCEICEYEKKMARHATEKNLQEEGKVGRNGRKTTSRSLKLCAAYHNTAVFHV